MKKTALITCISFITIFISAQEFNFDKLNGKSFVYKIKESMAVEYNCTTSYKWEVIGGVKYCNYITIGKNEIWDVTTDLNGKPLKICYKKAKDSLKLDFKTNGQVIMKGIWENKKVYESKTFSDNVSLENVLLLQTMDFNNRDKYVFDLIQYDKFPKLVAYRMYFKVTGEQDVTTSAGKFKCKTVDFSLTDLRGLFYTAYYWVSDSPEHTMVKIDNIPAMMGKTELVEIIE